MEKTNQHTSADDLQLHLMKETLRFLEDHNQRTYQDLDTLDGKARANIAAASLFLSFSAAFQLVVVSDKLPVVHLALLVLALILYGLMIFFSLSVVLPVEYHWPVAARWDEVSFYWDFKSEKEYIEQITSDYILALKLNQQAVDIKARNFKIGGILFGLIIVDLVVMSVVKLVS